ncbi:hypothetical protein DPMN_149234 [Dreissena polymorpha]|uniref:Uncharacterized protein n=1 Tax=Dreissena polymorpha TaxID=45954 RepID=A0A9D4J4S1_DREPO|nr:hypothetical protein DPMN_149234 [Dreissena polymorpha]
MTGCQGGMDADRMERWQKGMYAGNIIERQEGMYSKTGRKKDDYADTNVEKYVCRQKERKA